jgi:putative lipoprotein
MRLIFSLAFLLLAFGQSAWGQTLVAQQCASFGEAQYRRLDKTVDHIVLGDFPAPSLERFEAKAGSQAVSGAVTIQGKVTYRNSRPASETQFVCLLDAMDRPLFFYVLPVLAARSSPTPLVRGTPPPSQPASAAQTPFVATSNMQMQLRGLLRESNGVLQFTPCDGAPLALQDRTAGQELTQILHQLTDAKPTRPMFVEFYGQRSDQPGNVDALEVRRASVETAGCRERFDQREWLASGNDPAWRLEITGHDMMLTITGVTPLPAPRFVHGGLQRQGSAMVYATTEGATLSTSIQEARCVDLASGALFSYRVEVKSEGRTLQGCAAHNPAMPAP